MKQIGLKRLLALFMALVMCFSLLPASAFADSGEEGDFGVEDGFDPAPEEGGWDAEPCEHEPLEAVTENECADLHGARQPRRGRVLRPLRRGAQP